MNPIYTDIHIHTSENPDNLNIDYDWRLLLEKVKVRACGNDLLLSLTDHNTINKSVYIDIMAHISDYPMLHLLLGVELHIKYRNNCPAYHCHAFFKNKIDVENIDRINVILDKLYPHKLVEKKDESIPTLESIIHELDEYDYIMLPHGGQSHATFNKAIPRDTKFDTTMERSIYYNQFDGFTARSKDKLEDTTEYFQKLGIKDFVNLITCSDNYIPENYPSAKATDAAPFIPTWMLAEPSFDGLRMALSESTRLIYSDNKPESWAEYIRSAKLKSDFADIDVIFTPGLNVIIGGSSSGKTLLVDSLVKKIKGGENPSIFNTSNYKKFEVEHITIDNPTGRHPHYIEQNYIMQIVNSPNSSELTSIDILKSLFPKDEDFAQKVEEGIATLRKDVTILMKCVERIEEIEGELNNLSQIGKLLVKGEIRKNVIVTFRPQDKERENIKYSRNKYEEDVSSLSVIKKFLKENPLVIDCDNEVEIILDRLSQAFLYAQVDEGVSNVIDRHYRNYNEKLKDRNSESQSKAQEFQQVLALIKEYAVKAKLFEQTLQKIASYNVKEMSKQVVAMGHTLDVSNRFNLTKDKVRNAFNEFLKSEFRFASYIDITPDQLYKSHFSQRPKVEGYEQFIEKVVGIFMIENKLTYQITTKDGQDFHNLSAGWKTSVLLDLILGYEKDTAPIVIDQPEDNLATSYINDGLVQAIKSVKSSKQVILVSHNATIPMMGDAQNIIYCRNENDRIIIRSAALEGQINGEPVLDLVAKITDGGKASIKKRVKKYNLKKFRQ